MNDDLVKRLHDGFAGPLYDQGIDDLVDLCCDAADRIEQLEAALLEIFDHECRISDRSFIACTARGALWPRAALTGEKKDD